MDESSVRWVLCAAIVLAVVCIGLTAATPAAAQQDAEVIEDYEDGQWNATSPWTWSFASNYDVSVNSTNPIAGNYSGRVTTGGYANVILSSSNSHKPRNVSWKVRFNNHTGQYFGRLESGGSTVMRVEFNWAENNQIIVSDGGQRPRVGKVDWNTTNTLSFRHIDYQNNTYSVYNNGTEIASNLSFVTSTNSVDRMLQQQDSRTDDYVYGVTYDDLEFNASESGSEPITSDNLRLNAPPYMPNGSMKPYEVLYNDSGTWRDVTGSATVTSSNASVVAVNGSMLEANASINDTRSSLITAEYDGLNATQRVYVAPTEVEHIDVMTIWWKVTTMLSDSTIWWLLVATAIAVAATRVTSAFAGVGAYTMTVICGWVVGDVTTGVMGATVLIGVFIALNVSENLRPAY